MVGCKLKNLIEIESLNREDIECIIDLAMQFEQQLKGGVDNVKSKCKGKNVANMFFENSTRTRFSFEMACHNLGVRIFNFDTEKSSITKGENLSDTLENLWAIGINGVVLRHTKVGIIEDTLNHLKANISFINAGDGNRAHPTQALLDYYTMVKHFGSVEGKNIVIIGDITHSRVAKSNIELLTKFGANVTCCAPSYFQDFGIAKVKWSDNLDGCLKDADVAMCLRIQNERITEKIPLEDYIKNYQVNENNLNPKTLLMHPGPANRDIEVSSKLLDSEAGLTVLEQAKNGVFVRMAVLDLILGGQK